MHPLLQLMRLHQPTGIWLLLFPCWWSLALANEGKPPLFLFVLFALGAVVMRGAGCIVNDMLDREFDAKVERTKNRPLASGAVSMQQASLLLFALLCIALAIALLIMQPMLIILAVISLFLVAAYPLMKRITWYPQAFLGLTFNFGALMGWAAVTNTLAFPAFLLYLGAIFWTLGYDTIYAHQDKEDDQRIGVKSTALKLGNNSKRYITIFYAFAVLFWALASSGAYYYAALFAIALHFAWQIYSVNLDSPKHCAKLFKSNTYIGLLLLLGILL